MAIRDKDGNVYRLKGPNHLMGTQRNWDRKRVLIYNMKCDGKEVMKDPRNPDEKFKYDYDVRDIAEVLGLSMSAMPSPTDAQVVSAEEFLEDVAVEEPVIEEPVIEEPVIEEPMEEPPVVEEPTQPVDDRVLKFLQKHKVVFYCVPAVQRREVKDELYGDVYYRTSYGQKYTFEAIVVKEDDFNLHFWALKDIPENSVVYPKNRSKRWWRVQGQEEKTGGYLMYATPSDVNPSFD